MEDEDKIFGLIAHAEEAQKTLRDFQAAAQDAVKTLPGVAREALRDAAREFIVQGTEAVSRGLLEASGEAKAAAATLRSTWLNKGLLLLAIGLLFSAIAVAGIWWSTSSLREEAADLKAAIRAEEATLRELENKTWGIVLVETRDGKRQLRLKKGDKVGNPLKWKTGENGIEILP